MADEKYYVIEAQNKYYMRLSTVKNLEDVVDEFYTEEEIREMLGLDEDAYFCSLTVNSQAIKDELTVLLAETKKNGKKSFIISDEMMEAMKADYAAASDYIPGLRRVGNRVTYNEPADKLKNLKVKKKHAQAFVSLITGMVSVGFSLDLKYAYENYVGAIELCKKMVTREEAKKHLALMEGKYYEELQVVFDQVWDNPAQFAEPAVDQM